MKRIFDVRLKSEKDPESGFPLGLPATPYELLDALEKVRVKSGAPVHWKIDRYCVPYLNYEILEEEGSLYELNALAQKLSELDHPQQLAYRGLLSTECAKGGRSVPISRLIDFAHSTHCCQVFPELRSDYQLGRYYAEKRILPGTREVSDEQLEMIDYALAGKRQREAEGGVFVSMGCSETVGYVRQTAPIEKTRLDLTLQKPEYSILLAIYGKWDQNAGKRKGAVLELPLEEDVLNAILVEYDGIGSSEDVWNRIAWSGLDCAVPMLTKMIFDYGSENYYSESTARLLNDLAKDLAAMKPEDKTAYKALLEAMRCRSLGDAFRLLNTLNDYRLTPGIGSLTEIAGEKLIKAESLIPYVDMKGFGMGLLEESGGELTSYGLLTRVDGLPVAKFKEQPKAHGWRMSMTL